MDDASANPDKMLDYYRDASDQVVDWEDEVPTLRTALDMLRTAMESMPESVYVSTPLLDEAFEELTANQEHLEGFVRDVAHGFLRANGYGYWLDGDVLPQNAEWPTGTLRVDESQLDVGSADRQSELAQNAADDAAELYALLEEGDLLWVEWGSGGLTPDHPQWDEVNALLEQAAGNMDNPAYAVAFYEALGVDGIFALGGVSEYLAYEDTVSGSDLKGELVDPLLEGFATYTHVMPPELQEELLGKVDPESVDLEQERMQLAILFSGSGELYEPELLADAADTIVMSRINRGYVQTDLADAVILRSLAESPDASWYFCEETGRDFLLTHPLGFMDEDLGPPTYMGNAEAWLGVEDQEEIAELQTFWSAAVWMHARGIPVDLYDPETLDPIGIGARDRLSLGVGFIPIVGDVQAGVEAATGMDYITGEELSSFDRWLSAGAVVLPFGSGVFKSVRRNTRLADLPLVAQPQGVGSLPGRLRNKMKRINNQTAAGGDRGVSGSVSVDEAYQLGIEWVGPNYRVSSDGKALISADGLRQFRIPSSKNGTDPMTGEDYSSTGWQANFETRPQASGDWTSNVHLDVDVG